MAGAHSTDGSRSVPRWHEALPWAVLGLTVAVLVASLILSFGTHGWGSVGDYPVPLATAGVGALITARTWNRVGWLLLLEGVVVALTIATQSYADRTGAAALPGAAWIAWLFTIVLAANFLPLQLMLLLFPDGRLLSAKWKPVAWASVVVAVVGTACNAVANVNFSSNFAHLADPVNLVAGRSLHGVFNASEGLGPLLMAAGAASLVVRMVRSRGEERLQLKWVVYATLVAAVAVVVATNTVPNPDFVFGDFVPLIPIAAGVAILRYRLYDIDIVINKTLVYAALAAFITAVYVAIVVGIGRAVGSTRNLALSIVATAVVAVVFQPVRNRVQHLANRLVYGRRATPYEVLSEFTHGMAGAYAAEDLLPRMAQILGEGTGASRAWVWLRVGDALRPSASWPTATANEPLPLAVTEGDVPEMPGMSLSLGVHHQGELLGALSLAKLPGERLTQAEEQLAENLASGAGLVLRNVRLTAELLARLDELRASRQRIVAAQDEERRKLERNLHDGAQQLLVALQVKLSLAQRVAEENCRVKEQLGELKLEAAEALENLRDLARGIYPPLLADQGLAAALSAQARKAVLPVSVEADGISRYPQDTEAAVYFCCLEALQNVAKYAGATEAVVLVFEDDGMLAFAVSDDGAGFDMSATSYGTGLQGMADRLAALEGELRVASAPAQGTTVTGHLPMTVESQV